MLRIISCNTYLSYGTSSQKVSSGLLERSRLTVAPSIETPAISLKLLQNCEILWIIQPSYWLILRFLPIFMMIFWTQCSYFSDITPCSPLTVNQLGLPPAFTLVSCSAYSALKMDVICSSETLVDFQRTTRRYVPECSALHNHCCENLKSYILQLVSFTLTE
jgi:hypothetical protein